MRRRRPARSRRRPRRRQEWRASRVGAAGSRVRGSGGVRWPSVSNALLDLQRASPMSRAARLRSFSRQRRSSVPNRRGRVRRQRGPVRLAAQDRRQRVGRRPRPRTRACPSASRTARSRTPRCRCACRPRVPCACSGLMYAAVPRIMPACVIAGVVIVGDCDTFGADAPTGSIAFARPKSSTFTVPSGAHLDVRGLQIAMDDALLVRRFERLGDLLARSATPRRAGSRPRAIRCDEILALDQFHHERADAVRLLRGRGCARCSDD